jgi:tetratricopeptide (TPR) repeat protein
MTTKWLVTALLGLVLGGGGVLRAQTTTELLQKGIYLQETVGDLDGAIKVYKQVMQMAKESRANAAQAEYRVGLCQQKKGQSSEAILTFRGVIEDYPDQTEFVAKAQALVPSESENGDDSENGETLQDARELLTGELKDTQEARKLLLDIVQSENAEEEPETLVWAYIYLGYIEDRAKNRQSAVRWYEKASAVDEISPGSASIVKAGLQQPLVWLRHLDEPPEQSATLLKLQEARQALMGEQKDTEKAKKLLLDIVQGGKVGAGPETLVWAYTYLGYIADRAKNRESAIAWYQKALTVDGAPPPGKFSLAKFGLQKPLIWIRHLDEAAQPPLPTATPPVPGGSAGL